MIGALAGLDKVEPVDCTGCLLQEFGHRYVLLALGYRRSLAMKKSFTIRVMVLATFLSGVYVAHACSWAVGYFHQVTCLRGSIVGTYRGWPRWIRLHVARDNVTLRLYEYRWPVHGFNQMPLVKIVKTDHNGHFDFGDLPEGHYTLVIDWPVEFGDAFDVEIHKLPRPTTSMKIDVTPVYPDCTGGHEFISF